MSLDAKSALDQVAARFPEQGDKTSLALIKLRAQERLALESVRAAEGSVYQARVTLGKATMILHELKIERELLEESLGVSREDPELDEEHA